MRYRIQYTKKHIRMTYKKCARYAFCSVETVFFLKTPYFFSNEILISSKNEGASRRI